jgi:hypothetical protein
MAKKEGLSNPVVLSPLDHAGELNQGESGLGERD